MVLKNTLILEVLVEVMLIPLIASIELAAVAFRSPIRLLITLTVVPEDKVIPLKPPTAVVAPLLVMLYILFLRIFKVVALLPKIARVVGVVAPALLKV